MTRSRFWLILAVESVFFVLLAGWVLSRLDRLFEPSAIAVALMIIVTGDVITALIMQRFARPAITVEPGERDRTIGRVVSGFGHRGTGLVEVRGERWRAETDGRFRLSRGDSVRILARRGLKLRVEPMETD